MRGPPTYPKRAGARLPPVNEATAGTYSLPAPYKGWNARGNLANMDPLEAVVMDNIFPGVQEVSLRPGYVDWVTGFPANVRGLMAYNGGASQKLFASTNSSIYEVTSAGFAGVIGSGTIFDDSASGTFTGNWTTPVNAALTVAASTITFNSPGAALNLNCKLKNIAGTGDYKACFEDDWEIDTTFTILGNYTGAGQNSIKVGWTDANGFFYGLRLSSHPGTAAQVLGLFDAVSSQLSSDPGGGFVYAINNTVRIRVTRSGADYTVILNYAGGADRTWTETLHVFIDSRELPRGFSTPVVQFLQGYIRLDSCLITVGAVNSSTIIAGTSLAQGRNTSTYATGYAQQIKAAHGAGEVMVCGAPGSTSTDWLAVLPELLVLRPANILFEPFANDAINAVPLATTQANVAALVAACDALGIHAYFLNCPPVNGSTNAAPINSWLTTSGYTFYDIFNLLEGPTPNELDPAYEAVAPFTPDGIHWGDAGADVVVDAVNPWLSTIGVFAPVHLPVASCTDGRWQSVNFTTAGGSFMTAVNGTDSLKLYDGSTWTAITGVSSPAITGVTTSNLSYVSVHKKRQWFVEENTMNLWYLPVDSIAGAATQFPVGSLFRLGGYLVATGSWTLDAGSGMDDYFIIVTSNGEIAVYQGTDPASSTTWALVGVYEAGVPVGRKPLLDYGGDMLYLSRNGLIPLSKLVQSSVLDRSSAISFNIDGAFLNATGDYSDNNGWQIILHRTGTALIVNIPVSADTVSYQYVMNVMTKAWCRFTGWNASCWAVLGTDLYFAGGTIVAKAWSGTADGSTPITGLVAQAYNHLGIRGQSSVSLVRPNISVSGSATLSMAFDADFKAFSGQTLVSYTPLASGATWDASLWDSGIWDSGASSVEPKWTTIPNDLGYLHSFRLQLTTSTASFIWTSNNYASKAAGIL